MYKNSLKFYRRVRLFKLTIEQRRSFLTRR